MSNENMYVPKSILKDNLLIMCLAAVCFGTSASWNVVILLRLYYYEKIYYFFGKLEIRILVGKWNTYEVHIFTKSLVQKCWLEKTNLCLNTRLSVNKNFLHCQTFYWNLGKPLTFIFTKPNIKYILSYSSTLLSR